MKFILIAAAALTLASPACAKDNAPEAASADESAQKGQDTTPDPNRIICRKQDIPGTRIGSKRVCATAAQWAQIKADTRQVTERVQNGKFRSDGQ